MRDETEWKKENIRPFKIPFRLSEGGYNTLSVGEGSQRRESCISVFDQDFRKKECWDRQEYEWYREYEEWFSSPPDRGTYISPFSPDVHGYWDSAPENIWICPLGYDNGLTPQVERSIRDDELWNEIDHLESRPDMEYFGREDRGMPELWSREIESLECAKSPEWEYFRQGKIIEPPFSSRECIEYRLRRTDRMRTGEWKHTRDIEYTPLSSEEIERDDITLHWHLLDK